MIVIVLEPEQGTPGRVIPCGDVNTEEATGGDQYGSPEDPYRIFCSTSLASFSAEKSSAASSSAYHLRHRSALLRDERCDFVSQSDGRKRIRKAPLKVGQRVLARCRCDRFREGDILLATEGDKLEKESGDLLRNAVVCEESDNRGINPTLEGSVVNSQKRQATGMSVHNGQMRIHTLKA